VEPSTNELSLAEPSFVADVASEVPPPSGASLDVEAVTVVTFVFGGEFVLGRCALLEVPEAVGVGATVRVASESVVDRAEESALGRESGLDVRERSRVGLVCEPAAASRHRALFGPDSSPLIRRGLVSGSGNTSSQVQLVIATTGMTTRICCNLIVRRCPTPSYVEVSIEVRSGLLERRPT
jgi:hypothetical protein